MPTFRWGRARLAPGPTCQVDPGPTAPHKGRDVTELHHDPPSGPAPRRRRLGELLVEAGVLDLDRVEDALERSAPDERLGAALMRLEIIDEHRLADAVAAQLGLERVEVEYSTIETGVTDLLPARLAERHDVLPLRFEGHVLVVATADPSDVVALDDVRVATRVRSVRPVVATSTSLERARRRAYRVDVAHDVLDAIEEDDTGHEDDVEVVDEHSQPVVRLVDALIGEAVTARASDVHIEPDGDGVGVRVRVDGLLRETRRIPRILGRQVISRIKIMSKLDISERRLPQDGRAVIRVEGQEVDLRVSTMPTMHGETVVLRLLPKGADRVALADLGFGDSTLEALVDALGRPQGLVLVTGPTGSGKTSTLYAGLTAVADPTRNVLTLEDPVEVQLPGVNQTQIEPKIGLTFARGLRHVLRQDPDVVLVGEIRDQETARLAVEASFTGHLVLATLHTNDAPSAVARLVDLGAEAFLIASSLLLVVAQRLARAVCDLCAVVDEPSPELLGRLGLEGDELDDATLRRGTGCPACDDTGTRGRVAIGEVLRVTPAVRALVVAGAAETAVGRQARADGLVPLRVEAIRVAATGAITLEEALRITPDPSI
jgi:type IV pilus assembly protein PilB